MVQRNKTNTLNRCISLFLINYRFIFLQVFTLNYQKIIHTYIGKNTMKLWTLIKILFIAAGLSSLLFSCKSEEKTGTGDQVKLTVPQGFEATVVAENLGRGRFLHVNDNGDIYMMLKQEKDGKGIVALRDQDGDGKAEVIEYFGERTGTGIEIYNGYLYHSTPSAI